MVSKSSGMQKVAMILSSVASLSRACGYVPVRRGLDKVASWVTLLSSRHLYLVEALLFPSLAQHAFTCS